MSTAGFGTVDTSNWWCMPGGETNNIPITQSMSPRSFASPPPRSKDRGDRDCVMGMLLVSHFREEEDLLFSVFVEYFATES